MLDDRIILICGKGGVGRSVVSASLARCLAARGEQVLLCDMGAGEGGPSPLARLFGLHCFSPEPAPVLPGLAACQLTPDIGHRQFLQKAIPGGALLAEALHSEALRALMESAPSFAEMGIFYQLLLLVKATQSGNRPLYHHIIIDLPATGHAIALTGLPEILHRIIKHGPVATALSEGQSYLNNEQLCHSWVVALPEQLPVSEAFELAAGLQATSVPVGGIILNRRPQTKLSKNKIKQTHDLLSGQAPFLGQYEFERLYNAELAEERLKESDYRLLVIPEFQSSGQDLVREVTAHLAVVIQNEATE